VSVGAFNNDSGEFIYPSVGVDKDTTCENYFSHGSWFSHGVFPWFPMVQGSFGQTFCQNPGCVPFFG
jgi:hypothetical protein